jgi:hypothetical protein
MLIYLSNLRVVPGGAVGIDGRQRSYRGRAVAFLEMEVATRLRDLFVHLFPSLSDRPGLLSRLLISDVEVELIPSPLKEADLEQLLPFITLGSAAYNVASRFVERELHSQARIRLGYKSPVVGASAVGPLGGSGDDVLTSTAASGMDMEWPQGVGMGTASVFSKTGPEAGSEDAATAIVVSGINPITDERCGFVERLLDQKHNRLVFYVAGISELATAGAAYFLATRWKYLERRYPKGTPFLVVLRFESSDYRRWSVVFERGANVASGAV